MNHFAEAERLLADAADCVLLVKTTQLISRAAVHAQLAQVQVIEAAYDLQPAVVDAHVCETERCCRPGVVDGWPVRIPPVVPIKTVVPTNERL